MKCESCGKPKSFMVLFSDPTGRTNGYNKVLCEKCKEVVQVG